MKKIILSILFIIVFSNFVFARAGGGTSTSSHSTSTHTVHTHGNSSSSSSFGGYLFAGFIFLFIVLVRQFIAKQILKARKNLKQAVITDNSWDIKNLENITKKIFADYQDARSKKNLEPIKYLFFNYFFDYSKQKMEKDLAGKKNIIEDASIKSMFLMEILDAPGNNFDIFVMQIQANLREKYIYENPQENTKSGISNRKKYIEFIEYWSFIRIDGNWLIFDISEKYIPIKTLTEKFENRNSKNFR